MKQRVAVRLCLAIVMAASAAAANSCTAYRSDGTLDHRLRPSDLDRMVLGRSDVESQLARGGIAIAGVLRIDATRYDVACVSRVRTMEDRGDAMVELFARQVEEYLDVRSISDGRELDSSSVMATYLTPVEDRAMSITVVQPPIRKTLNEAGGFTTFAFDVPITVKERLGDRVVVRVLRTPEWVSLKPSGTGARGYSTGSVSVEVTDVSSLTLLR